MNIPILSCLIFVPIAGMILILVTPKDRFQLIRTIATIATAAVLLLTIKLVLNFNSHTSGMQFVERVLWIPQLNVYYHLGIDGVSILMIFATALLSTP